MAQTSSPKATARFATYKAAIAFDRHNKGDIITHQRGGRCCSDDFAKSLAVQLGNGYSLNQNGIFTDTANYTDAIGECTNISVGYLNEHTKNETLDMNHLIELRNRMVGFDWSKLEFKRKPGERDPLPFNWEDWGGYGRINSSTTAGQKLIERPENNGGLTINDYYDDRELTNLIRDYPAETADLLESYGATKQELLEHIYYYTKR